MTGSHSVSDRILNSFLDQYCPNPEQIRGVLARHNLRTIVDKSPGQIICSQGDRAEAYWLILHGEVEVFADGERIRERRAGELIGEQAFLKTLLPKGDPTRTATLIARDNVQLLCIDAAFHEHMSWEERTTWFQTFAVVANEKLEQATHARADLQRFINDRNTLLTRFVDEIPLGIVKRALDEGVAVVDQRDAIVWFSDIANFSRWASDQEPAEAARLIKRLLSAQVDLVRGSGGIVDKLMGDGLMAFWFVDTTLKRREMPPAAIRCATAAVQAIHETLSEEGLSGRLDIRISLHCGPVAFGDFGARDRIAVTLLGHTVNRASRFEQASAPNLGRIRISGLLREAALKSGADLDAFSGPYAVEVKHGETIDIFTL